MNCVNYAGFMRAIASFEDDYYRTGFLGLLGHVQPSAEGDEEEDASEGPPPRPAARRWPSTPVGWYVAAFFFALLILSLMK